MASQPAILEHICRQFKMPNSFESFVYVSQVLQALSIKVRSLHGSLSLSLPPPPPVHRDFLTNAIQTASEHWRRCKPTCMGVVYWQLNDIWQGAPCVALW
jgi:beta-mannosidase